jgi:hypothetical protein
MSGESWGRTRSPARPLRQRGTRAPRGRGSAGGWAGGRSLRCPSPACRFPHAPGDPPTRVPITTTCLAIATRARRSPHAQADPQTRAPPRCACARESATKNLPGSRVRADGARAQRWPHAHADRRARTPIRSTNGPVAARARGSISRMRRSPHAHGARRARRPIPFLSAPAPTDRKSPDLASGRSVATKRPSAHAYGDRHTRTAIATHARRSQVRAKRGVYPRS